jgi:outer membrane protein assembly factor BamB
MTASPILDGNRIFQATWRGDVVCLDVETGKEYWRYPYGNEIVSQVLLMGRELIVGSMTGAELVAVNADDGSMAWRVHRPSRRTWSLAARDSKFFVGAGDGGCWTASLAKARGSSRRR